MNTKQLALAFILVCVLATIEWWYPAGNPHLSFASPRVRFPVEVNGRWGYIDAQGAMRIEPQFYIAGDFNEGLAAVRKGGTYGYIDTTGNFAIAEQFDFAEAFNDGIARVYINARPYYIDHAGRLLFEHSFHDILEFGNKEYTVAITKSDKHCVIDRNGRMLTDTIFDWIDEFSEGKATAFVMEKWAGDDEIGKWDTNYTACVIDSTGAMLVPPGTYTRIQNFSEGKTHAERIVKSSEGDFKEERSEFIDAAGEVLFSVAGKPYTVFTSYKQGFRNGKLIVNVWDSAHEDLYPGVIDDKGDLLFSNEDLSEITPYYNGIAFAKPETGYNWILINEKGEQLYHAFFERFYTPFEDYDKKQQIFSNGRALVRIDKYGWCMIDAKGLPIDSMRFGAAYYDVEEVNNEAIVFRDTICHLWFAGEDAPMKGQFEQIAFGTISDKLIRVRFSEYSSTWGYVNRAGEVIWESKQATVSPPQSLNVDHMMWTYAQVSSIRDTVERGYWISPNYYRSLADTLLTFTAGKLQVYIDSSQEIYWSDNYVGYPVYIINDSADTVWFTAQDSRMDAFVQAKNTSGEWVDIEYTPPSWCGNSYHTVWLPPGHYWSFNIPKYEGSYLTQLRIRLEFRDKISWKEYKVVNVFSNEISGSVNPAQFWRKPSYYSENVMDPYTY